MAEILLLSACVIGLGFIYDEIKAIRKLLEEKD